MTIVSGRIGQRGEIEVEAKDTVMSGNNLCILVCQQHREDTLEAKNCNGLDCDVCQLTKQAEISFKAGQANGFSLERQGEAYLEGKQAGIQEVVEWVKNHIPAVVFAEFVDFLIEWQAKLKEWGVIKDESC